MVMKTLKTDLASLLFFGGLALLSVAAVLVCFAGKWFFLLAFVGVALMVVGIIERVETELREKYGIRG